MLSTYLMTKNSLSAIILILILRNICQNFEIKRKTLLLCVPLESSGGKDLSPKLDSASTLSWDLFHGCVVQEIAKEFISLPPQVRKIICSPFFTLTNMKEENCAWWFVESRCVWDLLFPWLAQKLVSRLLPTQQYGEPHSQQESQLAELPILPVKETVIWRRNPQDTLEKSANVSFRN